MNATTPPKLIPPFHSTAGERDVSDGADEREHRDDGADDRTPKLRQQRVIDQEERLPSSREPTPRAPRRSGGRPAISFQIDAQFHHVVVADRGEAAR
jgi:hypothetical protein